MLSTATRPPAQLTRARSDGVRVLYDQRSPHPDGISAVTYSKELSAFVVFYTVGQHAPPIWQMRRWRRVQLLIPEGSGRNKHTYLWDLQPERIDLLVRDNVVVRPGHIVRCAHVRIDVLPANDEAAFRASFTCSMWHDEDRALLPGFTIKD